MVNFQRTCRTCMKSDDKSLIYLFDLFKTENNTSLKLADVLMQATSLQIAEKDGLPQNLCNECERTLQVLYTFRKQAHKSESELKKIILTSAVVKNENSETDFKNESQCDYVNYFDNFSVQDVLPTSNQGKDLSDNYVNDNGIEETDVKVKVENITDLYRCTDCSITFENQKCLGLHLKEHKKDELLKCNQCDMQFDSKKILVEHKKQHSDSKENKDCKELYRCLQCMRTFVTEEEFVKCVLLHNGISESKIKEEESGGFKCAECDQIFKKYRSLISHFKKHSKVKKKKSFTCDYCNRGFTQKGPLKRHLALHTKEKPYKCTECPQTYSRHDAWVTHMRKHSGIKPYACEHCDKAFLQLCSLKDHIRTHTGETPFLCSECGRGFKNSSNLRQHLKRHTGVKPFSCNLCPLTFCTKGQMKCHMDTHTGVHPYSCDDCGASFTKSSSLKKHKFIHLGIKPFACDGCNMSFTCKDHLKRHQRTHTGEKPYRCARCPRAYTQSNDLIKHMRVHVGQNIYACTVCGAKFRLLRELRQHYPTHYAGAAGEAGEAGEGEGAGEAGEGRITITFNRSVLAKGGAGDVTINIGAEKIN